MAKIHSPKGWTLSFCLASSLAKLAVEVVIRQQLLRTSLRLSNKGSSVPSLDSGATTVGTGTARMTSRLSGGAGGEAGRARMGRDAAARGGPAGSRVQRDPERTWSPGRMEHLRQGMRSETATEVGEGDPERYQQRHGRAARLGAGLGDAGGAPRRRLRRDSERLRFRSMKAPPVPLDRDLLHDAAGDAPGATVIDLGGRGA